MPRDDKPPWYNFYLLGVVWIDRILNRRGAIFGGNLVVQYNVHNTSYGTMRCKQDVMWYNAVHRCTQYFMWHNALHCTQRRHVIQCSVHNTSCGTMHCTALYTKTSCHTMQCTQYFMWHNAVYTIVHVAQCSVHKDVMLYNAVQCALRNTTVH